METMKNNLSITTGVLICLLSGNLAANESNPLPVHVSFSYELGRIYDGYGDRRLAEEDQQKIGNAIAELCKREHRLPWNFKVDDSAVPRMVVKLKEEGEISKRWYMKIDIYDKNGRLQEGSPPLDVEVRPPGETGLVDLPPISRMVETVTRWFEKKYMNPQMAGELMKALKDFAPIGMGRLQADFPDTPSPRELYGFLSLAEHLTDCLKEWHFVLVCPHRVAGNSAVTRNAEWIISEGKGTQRATETTESGIFVLHIKPRYAGEVFTPGNLPDYDSLEKTVEFRIHENTKPDSCVPQETRGQALGATRN